MEYPGKILRAVNLSKLMEADSGCPHHDLVSMEEGKFDLRDTGIFALSDEAPLELHNSDLIVDVARDNTGDTRGQHLLVKDGATCQLLPGQTPAS